MEFANPYGSDSGFGTITNPVVRFIVSRERNITNQYVNEEVREVLGNPKALKNTDATTLVEAFEDLIITD